VTSSGVAVASPLHHTTWLHHDGKLGIERNCSDYKNSKLERELIVKVSDIVRNMAPYQFTKTQDWFSGHIERWSSFLPLVQSEHPRALEVGSWEGRSAVFLLDRLCGSGGEVVCVDHFDLFSTPAGRERFRKTSHNLALTGKKFRIISQFSVPALMTILTEEVKSKNPGFDWIYIDGSHGADDTMLDGELAWRLAKKYAIIIFDDYHWDREPEDSLRHPKRGIDAFLLLHQGEYERISTNGEYQMVVRKLTDMRIGFLPGDGVSSRQAEMALAYGMHVASAANATGAAVTAHSLVKRRESRDAIRGEA